MGVLLRLKIEAISRLRVMRTQNDVAADCRCAGLLAGSGQAVGC